RARSLLSPESKSTHSRGAALSTESRRLAQLLSFALSGSSGRKMSWPATCDGQITATRTGRTQSRLGTIRLERLFGIHLKKCPTAEPQDSTRMRRPFYPTCPAADCQ